MRIFVAIPFSFRVTCNLCLLIQEQCRRWLPYPSLFGSLATVSDEILTGISIMLPYPSLFGSLATEMQQTEKTAFFVLPYPSLFGSLATQIILFSSSWSSALPYPSLFGSLATVPDQDFQWSNTRCHTLLFSGHLQPHLFSLRSAQNPSLHPPIFRVSHPIDFEPSVYKDVVILFKFMGSIQAHIRPRLIIFSPDLLRRSCL